MWSRITEVLLPCYPPDGRADRYNWRARLMPSCQIDMKELIVDCVQRCQGRLLSSVDLYEIQWQDKRLHNSSNIWVFSVKLRFTSMTACNVKFVVWLWLPNAGWTRCLHKCWDHLDTAPQSLRCPACILWNLMCTALEWSCLSFWQDASPWTGTQLTLKFIEAEFQFVWFL